MAHSRFFDSVLQELSAGNMQDGINMLAGMLDTADQRTEPFGAVCAALRVHALGAMLREDPLFAGSPANPGNDAAMLQLIAFGDITADVSQTGRRLFTATSEIKLSRALRERHLGAGRRVARSWQHGRRICVLGGANLAAARLLAGRDLNNITVIDDDHCTITRLRDLFGGSFQLVEASPMQFLRDEAGPGRFDVICSVELADSLTPPALAALMPAMRRRLAPGGSIELAALAALHPGSGWRRAYLDWEPCCHEAGSLAAMAEAADLESRVYHDETACVLWCEMNAIAAEQANPDHQDRAKFYQNRDSGGMS